eukprot:CAMPEP_0196589608 /NCGR_PEP_ID=MMETSP1081-20130531/64059_1 /TAXON_ID=36882 /ORGANISM="Pyramimonas amylifera, Strain CCMP720" /LENGTH=318 /DNA_ID=CAMNT_0041912457 /DNA_START=74 /DNA_END=1027 /DNA_ORIENTATION=+
MEARTHDNAQRRLQHIHGHFRSSSYRSYKPSINGTASSMKCGLLQGQVAIITGSGQGLGAATARLFADEGACVVVSDIDASKSNQVASDICSKGGRAISVPGDVTDPDFPAALVSACVASFSGLHILVNNAGFTWDAVLHKMTPKQWQTMLDVHCTAPFRLIQAAAPFMRDAAKEELKSGKAVGRCILNVSSTSGVHGSAGQANYSTAKMGVVGLTKTVAKEWGAFNIRCNALVFGAIKTRLVAAKEAGATIEVDGEKAALGIPGNVNPDVSFGGCPLGRAGTPEEAAGAMLMVACHHSSYIMGKRLKSPVERFFKNT